MTKKQYYIPGKEYEWTKETWDTVLKHMGYLADCYGPFATEGENVKGFPSTSVKENHTLTTWICFGNSLAMKSIGLSVSLKKGLRFQSI